MANLRQVIKFAAVPNLRVTDRTEVNTAVGAKLNIVTNHHRPKGMDAGKGLRFCAFAVPESLTHILNR